MTQPSRARRLFSFVLFRLVPLALIIGLVIVSVQLGQSILRYLGEQNEYTQRSDFYAQTATAISADDAAEPVLTPTPQVRDSGARFAKRPAVRQQAEPTPVPQGPVTAVAQAFATNTPQGPAVTPTPEVTSTPRPLPTLFIYGEPGSGEMGGTAVPTAVSALDRQGYDLMNILLLGNDGELTDDGFIRTDTMIIVSINRTTGTVSMLSLPRDLYVYIPGWTMQRLNLAYIHGQAGGWTDGGFGLMRQTLFYNLGINVHYYAMVNLTGFKEIVEAVGGVDLAVDCAIQDLPLIGAEVPSEAQRINDDGYYVLPVGYYSMSGAEALWYARSRHNSSDFDRGRRQQQVLRAVWRKARDNGLLTNLPQLWAEGQQFIETNLTLEDLLGLVPLALSLEPSRIEDFTLIRTYHTTPWQTPDGDYVQLPNYETMRPLLQDFYSPPTQSQITVEGARIAVYNGTTNANLDRVAAERLGWEGFGAIAVGAAENADYPATMLVDYTGQTKGSSLQEIAASLNVQPENIRIEPDPNREYDFAVIVGASYNSCTVSGVLPVDSPQ